MTALYSLQGMHQINASGEQLLRRTALARAGDDPFAEDRQREGVQHRLLVFVQEMLHLQLAANLRPRTWAAEADLHQLA